MGFDVKFWGVRGSIACAGANHVKYGGNTSCIEMRVGDHRIILDAGTGLRLAGQTFSERKSRRAFHPLDPYPLGPYQRLPVFRSRLQPGLEDSRQGRPPQG